MPVPQPHPISEEMLAKFDALMWRCERKRYKGYSPCRLCNHKHNGSLEYRFHDGDTTWAIPQGLRHYLTEHNVHLSPAFQAVLERHVS